MKVGDRVRVKDNLAKELIRLKFDVRTTNNMVRRFVGSTITIKSLWTDDLDGQQYATVDLCCEIPVQCLEVVQNIQNNDLNFV